jgi:hypothetical protein
VLSPVTVLQSPPGLIGSPTWSPQSRNVIALMPRRRSTRVRRPFGLIAAGCPCSAFVRNQLWSTTSASTPTKPGDSAAAPITGDVGITAPRVLRSRLAEARAASEGVLEIESQRGEGVEAASAPVLKRRSCRSQ